MKTIALPPPVVLPDNKTLSFPEFLINHLLGDQQFGATLKDVRLAAEIQSAALNFSGAIQISDEAHSKLCQVMETPMHGYNPKSAIVLLPFFDAIANAT